MTGLDKNRGRRAVLSAVFVTTLLLVGCGGGGGGGGTPEQPLYAVNFSVPNFSGIFLNEQVSLVFSEDLDEDSINFDSIRIRTGPNGGIAPRGEFILGTFGNGIRDTSKKNVVTFLPAIPTEASLSDTGYAAGATYTVVVAAWPALNTLRTRRGKKPAVQVFASDFTTLPSNAPLKFLDSDFPGSPFVEGSFVYKEINGQQVQVPANGADDVLSNTSVQVVFSEPLMPSSALLLNPNDLSNANVRLLNITSLPPTTVKASYFLAQTRDFTTLTLNPLQPLDDASVYQVIVSTMVTDLIGNPVNEYTASFSTFGQPPAPTELVEDFGESFFEDEAETTANWGNIRFADLGLVGSQAGALTAVFAPWAGNGSDGPLTIGPGQTVSLPTTDATTGKQRVWRYTSIDIQIGGTLVAAGDHALVLMSQGTVDIAGLVDLSGAKGSTGYDGDGSSETRLTPGDPTGGAGGVGGPGGFQGGDGGNTVVGDAGFLEGQDGGGPGPDPNVSGRVLGGGRGGFEGDISGTDATDPNWWREGGGGGGRRVSGGDSSSATRSEKGDKLGGTGGSRYGEGDFSDVDEEALVGLRIFGLGNGGSGGGGGGAEDDSGAFYNNTIPEGTESGPGDGKATNADDGGGGGGGGGGALQILAFGDVTISGTIVCNGGGGGDTESASGGIGSGEAGGGGSGGSVWVQSYGDVTLTSGAQILCLGGSGGNIGKTREIFQGVFESAEGGEGAPGYIRFEDRNGVIAGLPHSGVDPAPTTGTFAPALSLDSVGYRDWFNTRRANPRYGVPTETFQLNGGTVVIEYQATREDVTTPGDNPDLTEGIPSAWVTGDQIDQISNRQWIRFRVRMNVPADHPFTTPLPLVDDITVPISFD
jgi:hypothetical protein